LKNAFWDNQKVAKKNSGVATPQTHIKLLRFIMNQNTVELQALINKISSSPEYFSNRAIYEALISILHQGLIPLPVAPKQCAKKYPKWYKDKKSNTFKIARDKKGNIEPKYSGKNPSYLDAFGSPNIINHKDFKNRFPSYGELKTWFCNPNTGIGTRGGNGISWIDLDVKNLENPEEFIADFIEKNNLSESWIERTPSGGCHIPVMLGEKPDFTKFSIGEHKDIGEIIDDELFIVCAPTTGYTAQNKGNLACFDKLADLNIQPSRAKKTEKAEKSNNILNSVQNLNNGDYLETDYSIKISHQKLFSQKARNILVGNLDDENNRSKAIAKAYNEFYGWQNYLALNDMGLDINEADFDSILSDAFGVDLGKLERVKKPIKRFACHPAIWHASGDTGFWLKIKLVNFTIFKSKCPESIQQELRGKIPKSHEDKFIYTIDGEIFESDKPVNIQELKNWLNAQKFTADIEINESEFKFPDKDFSGKIVLIKSPMGTGKTQESLDYIQKLYAKDSTGVFWVSARNKLLYQVIAEASKRPVNIYHLNEDDGIELLEDTSTHNALCAESLAKIDGYFVGRDVWIDEVVTVLNQILGGGTVKGSKQGFVLEVLKSVFRSARTVFCLDANLRDIESELIRRICPEKEIVKIENKHQGRLANFDFHQTIKINDESGEKIVVEKDYSSVVNQISQKDSKPFIVADSKNLCDVLEKRLNDLGKVGFNLNQETSEELSSDWLNRNNSARKLDSEKWAHDLLKTPTEFMSKTSPDFFIGSPTIENGVSYVGNHFSEKIAIFQGVLGVNGMLQMLFRNRNNEILTTIHCPLESTIHKKYSPLPENLENQIEFIRKNKRYENKDYQVILSAALKRCCDEFWGFYKPSIDRLAKFEDANLRACLVYKLKELGHSVTFSEHLKDAEQSEVIKEIKKELREVESVEIFDAEPFVDKEECDTAKQKNPGKRTNRRASKFFILDRLPGIENTSCWSSDFILKFFIKDKKQISNIENVLLFNSWEMYQNYVEFFDYSKLNAEYVVPKSYLDDRWMTLKILKDIKFDEFIQKLRDGLKICKNSPEVEEVLGSLENYEELGIKLFEVNNQTVGKDENIATIKRILNFLGLDLGKGKKEVTEKGRVRFYGLNHEQCESEEFKTIYECLARKYEKFMETEYKKPDWSIQDDTQATNQRLAKVENEISEPEGYEIPVFCGGMVEILTIGKNEITHVLMGLKNLVKGCKINCELTAIRLKKILTAYKQSESVRSLINDWDCTFPDFIVEYSS
jgi:hypothetical protein